VQIKLILKAKHIPVGTDVTKPTGTKRYKLLDDIKVYKNNTSEQEEPDVVSAGERCKLLVSLSDSDFYVNAIPDDSRLGVNMSLDSAIDFLETIKLNQELATSK
jgi:hypothetical protein